jgi:hypothetical protein
MQSTDWNFFVIFSNLLAYRLRGRPGVHTILVSSLQGSLGLG